jgi:hypothetical protein
MVMLYGFTLSDVRHVAASYAVYNFGIINAFLIASPKIEHLEDDELWLVFDIQSNLYRRYLFPTLTIVKRSLSEIDLEKNELEKSILNAVKIM